MAQPKPKLYLPFILSLSMVARTLLIPNQASMLGRTNHGCVTPLTIQLPLVKQQSTQVGFGVEGKTLGIMVLDNNILIRLKHRIIGSINLRV
jgi:hypothetical protein